MKTKKFSIDCTGDACVGDVVKFEKAVFKGRYPNAKFDGYETIEGEIIKDSYGAAKQQHTFTLLLADGTKKRIKGRNLYRNGCKRQEWDDESKRDEVLNEKHMRGGMARNAAAIRKASRPIFGNINDPKYIESDSIEDEINY